MFPSFISILDIQSWWEVPSIAHFCSLFRNAFNLLDFDIEDLEEALLADGTEETSWLQELIVRLLIGCLDKNEKISLFNYQMFLRRLFRQKCKEYERKNPFNTDTDFQLLPLRTKVDILHALCDFRLDADDVFEVLKNLEADSLRVEPLGYDNKKSAYWYFYGTRLYREDSRNCEETIWQVICFTETDWYKLAEKFKSSESKCEKGLYQTLSENFITELPRLFKEKECLARKRLLESLPRRSSNRLIEKSKIKDDDKKEISHLEKYQEEKGDKLLREREEREKLNNKRRRNYEERLKRIQESSHESDSSICAQRYEMAGVKIRDKKTKIRQRKNSQSSNSSGDNGATVSNNVNNPSNRNTVRTPGKTQSKSTPTGGAKPVGRQTNNSLASATDGQILIESSVSNPHRKKLKTSQVFSQTEEDLQTGLHKILDHVKDDEDAWPFVDPVEEEYAPNYYSIIRKPMDLQRMDDRLESGHYKSVSKFKADFQLIVNNCRLYNGSENEYTEMVDNLVGVFERACERYLDQITSSDEEIAVEYADADKDKNNKRKKVDVDPIGPPSKRKPTLAAQTDKKKEINEIVEEEKASNDESEGEGPKHKKSKNKETKINKKDKSKKDKDSGKKKSKDVEKEIEVVKKNKKDDIKIKSGKKHVDEVKIKKDDHKNKSNKKDSEEIKDKQHKKEDNIKNSKIKKDVDKINKKDEHKHKSEDKQHHKNNEKHHKNNKKDEIIKKSKEEPKIVKSNKKELVEESPKPKKIIDEKSKSPKKESESKLTKVKDEPKSKIKTDDQTKKSHHKKDLVEHEKNKKQSKNVKTKLETKQIIKNDLKNKKMVKKPGRKLKRSSSSSSERGRNLTKGKKRALSRSLSRSLSRDRWSDSPPPSWPPSSPEGSQTNLAPKKIGNKKKMYNSDSEEDNKVNQKYKRDLSKDDKGVDKLIKKSTKDAIDRSPSPKHKDKHNKLRETIEKLKAKSELAKAKEKDLKVFDFESEKTKENRDITQKNDKLKKLDKNKVIKPKPGTKLKDLIEDENSTADSLQSSDKNKINKKAPVIVKNPPKTTNNIEALTLATEQTLKDINKWLDDTPKYPEFSSASNSPSHFSLDDFDSGANKGIAVDDRKKLDKPAMPRKDGIKEVKKRPFPRDPTKVFRRREVQRTIDRLQPGKSKGNLITNVQTTVKQQEELFPLGPLSKIKDTKNSLIVKTDESAPKLSLGSVLDSFGEHKFVDDDIKETEDKVTIAKKEESVEKVEEDSTKKDEKDSTTEVKEEIKKIVEPVKEIKLDNSPGKATPNLSAWFKAFGAPKIPPPSAPAVPPTPVYKRNEPKEVPIEEKKEEILVRRVPISDPSPNNSESPNHGPPVRRQRKVSTGSSMSERSSFSQDLDSPRVGMDERMGAYPAPYPSPLHKSPAGASPNLQSPRPDVSPKAAAYPFNGQIRVGFYQDTVSQKSSPDKSCSPKDNPQSPYTQYSEHVYTPPTTTQPVAYSTYNNPYYSHAPNYSTSNPTPPYNAEQNTPANFYDTNKSLTDQYQAKNYVNSPVNNQLNSPQLNSPVNQQMNSPQSANSPLNQQVNSPQMNSPLNQQVNSPQMNSPLNQQVNSPQMNSPLNQQVNSPLNQEIASPVAQQLPSPNVDAFRQEMAPNVNPFKPTYNQPQTNMQATAIDAYKPTMEGYKHNMDAYKQMDGFNKPNQVMDSFKNVEPFKPNPIKPKAASMDPFKQVPPPNVDPYKTGNMDSAAIDPYKQATANIDAYKQAAANMDAFKQAAASMDAYKAEADAYKQTPATLDVYKQTPTSLDGYKQAGNMEVYKQANADSYKGGANVQVSAAIDPYRQMQVSPGMRQLSNPNSPNVDYRQPQQQQSNVEPYRQLQQAASVDVYRQQDVTQQARVEKQPTASFPVKKRAYSEMAGFDAAQEQYTKEQFNSRNLEMGLMSGRQVNIGQEQSRQEQATRFAELLEQRTRQNAAQQQEQTRDAPKYVHQNIPEVRATATQPQQSDNALRNMGFPGTNPYSYGDTSAPGYSLNIPGARPGLDGKIDMSKYTNMGYQGPGDMNFRAQFNKTPSTTATPTNSTDTSTTASMQQPVSSLQQSSSLPMRYTDSGNVMNMGGYKTMNAQPQTAHMNTQPTNAPPVPIPRPTYQQALEMDQIRGNLANLSHIVDRYQNDERLMQSSGFYADKNIPAQHMAAYNKQMAAAAGLPMFTQPNSMPYMNSIQATSGMYNRPMAELQNSGMSMRQPDANPSLQQQIQEKKTSKRKRASKTATPPAAPNAEAAATSGASSTQGFQSYTGLKNPAGMEPSAISLKTASVVPGSAFNFGPGAPGLAGLSSGLYGDKDAYPNYLDDYRSTPQYYMAAAAAAQQRATPENAEKTARAAHQSSNPQAGAAPPGYPFMGAPQGRPPSYPLSSHGPFIPPHQAPLMDASSPLYQQYLQAGLHQGLLGPPGAYPPGYHALSMRQQYDPMTRPSPWH